MAITGCRGRRTLPAFWRRSARWAEARLTALPQPSLFLRRRDVGLRWIGHRLVLRQCGDRRGADRALLVIEPALADCDAVARMMIDHLEADPFRHRQPMEIERHVTVDEAEP